MRMYIGPVKISEPHMPLLGLEQCVVSTTHHREYPSVVWRKRRPEVVYHKSQNSVRTSKKDSPWCTKVSKFDCWFYILFSDENSRVAFLWNFKFLNRKTQGRCENGWVHCLRLLPLCTARSFYPILYIKTGRRGTIFADSCNCSFVPL